MKDKSKPACYAPWITTYEQSKGGIVPCCEFTKHDRENNVKAIPLIPTEEHMDFEDRFRHPEMEKFKKRLMTTPILPIECMNCVADETAGLKSLRKQFDEHVDWAEKYTDYKWNVDKFEYKSMDYRESNLCNFSCKMCGSSLSSTHAKIEGQYGKTGILKNIHKLQEHLNNLDSVTHVNFLGGEPVLTDSMWIIIDEIRKRNLQEHIYVSIVTNGSLLHRHNDNLMDKLDGFKFVDISISIDCVGEQHNYWRHKNTWDIVQKNCETLYKWKQGKDNVRCCTRTAIGWPNAYAARDVFDMFKDAEDVQQRWNVITNPQGLALKMLPQEDLEKLYVYWKDYPEVAEMFKNITSDPNYMEMATEKHKFVRHNDWHKNSFTKAFPELAHVWDSIKLSKKYT